ncbi:MAG: LptF/LptG family permease [Saprospiraceae bacterium]|jgi:lipopolysaccharide export system permease protein
MNIGTLDKYLIGKYMSTFGFSLLICTMISVVIDFSDKVKSFLNSGCTLYEIVFEYFVGFIFNIAGLLLPLYTLIAVVFFTSRLAFNSEILSIFNAGISFNRLLRPYLIAGSMVVALHLFLNHVIIPRTNKHRLQFERTYVWTDQEKGRTSNVHFLVAPDIKVFIQGYNKKSQTAAGLRLEKFNGNKVESILYAASAKWKGEPNRWELNSYTIRSFDGIKEEFIRGSTPLDTAINITPQDFIWYHNQNEEMTTQELGAAISRSHERGLSNTKNYEIETHRRTADAFTNLILTIIGLSIAGRKVRGGMGLHLAVGIGLGALYILLSKFAVSFATSGVVNIALGVWLPNLFFLAIAFWLIGRAQK